MGIHLSVDNKTEWLEENAENICGEYVRDFYEKEQPFEEALLAHLPERDALAVMFSHQEMERFVFHSDADVWFWKVPISKLEGLVTPATIRAITWPNDPDW